MPAPQDAFNLSKDELNEKETLGYQNCDSDVVSTGFLFDSKSFAVRICRIGSSGDEESGPDFNDSRPSQSRYRKAR